MADVDQCTRYAEAGLCDNPKLYSLKISAIKDELRNIIFRGKTADQIEAMLILYSNIIKQTISDKFGFKCNQLFPSSNNNRDGADLYCILPSGNQLTIEVKFGSYTDKAAGMDNISKIFGTDVFSTALSIAQRKKWQSFVVSEYPDLSSQLKRTTDTLNAAAKAFNSFIAQNGHKLSKASQAYMEEYLLNNSGNRESHTDNYIRFEVNKDGSKISDVMLVQKGIGEWIVDDINLLDPNDEKSRINIFVHNTATQLQIKFTLNNKNDLHLTNPAIDIRSKYMLNSPSWNVWIKKQSQ